MQLVREDLKKGKEIRHKRMHWDMYRQAVYKLIVLQTVFSLLVVWRMDMHCHAVSLENTFNFRILVEYKN